MAIPRSILPMLLLLAAVTGLPSPHAARAQAPSAELKAAAARLTDEALRSHDAYDGLSELCDRVGHRLAGEPSLDSAIAWAAARMRAEGLANVHTERVMVPAWVRGRESAEMLAPRRKALGILGLGMSVGTPPGGITAEVVAVDSFPQLEALGEAGIRGRIVLYDAPFRSYGETVRYRGAGASRAARYGAVAVLVRSVTPVSLDTPHTGSLNYTDSLPRIPAAAVTVEDATLLHRLCARGVRVTVRLAMEAHQLPDVPSANVMGEIVGREHPEEIVAIGGHIDSWDVGQGAQDDGVGCVISMEAAHLMQRLGMRPRRTVRVVLWVNEENGLRGGRAYRDAHRDELPRHVAALESDIGNGLVRGFSLDLRQRPAPGDSVVRDTAGRAATDREREAALATLGAIVKLLDPSGSTRVEAGGGGSDVSPIAGAGVPAIGFEHDQSRYFEIHHTAADTFDKIDPENLSRNVASMAVMAWALAEWPTVLRPAP
jgi:carboxypeptidase Q